jgi:EmrB/QacA subfamily drug resistance transporter
MPQRYRVLLLASVAVFVVSLDLFIVNIAFPSIERDFSGTSDATLSWVLNAYAIVSAALLVPAGRIADLLGRKRLFLAGLVTFVAASALCAAAQSPGLLIGARALQAAGGAALVPTSLALLLPEFPPAQRPVAVAIWSATGAIAAAAGPPIGGLLVQMSWRWVFLVNVPVGLLTALLAARTFRESRDPAGGRFPDVAGAGLLVVAISGLTLSIVKAPDWGWGDPRIVGLQVTAAVLLGLFLARCARHPVPVIELGLLRAPGFAAANIAGLFFWAGFGAMLLSTVLFLTRVWNEGILTAGLQIAPGPLAAAAFAVPAPVLARWFGARAVATTGGLLFAAGAVWRLRMMGTDPDYAAALLPSMLIGGAGVGLVIPTLANAVVASLPPARFATGSAVYGMVRGIGIALGVAVLVAVLGTPRPDQAIAAFDRAWELMLATGLAAALLSLTINPLRAGRAVQEAGYAVPRPAAVAVEVEV